MTEVFHPVCVLPDRANLPAY